MIYLESAIQIHERDTFTGYVYLYLYLYHIFIEYVPVGYYYSFARCTSPQGQQTKSKQCTQGFNCVSW